MSFAKCHLKFWDQKSFTHRQKNLLNFEIGLSYETLLYVLGTFFNFLWFSKNRNEIKNETWPGVWHIDVFQRDADVYRNHLQNVFQLKLVKKRYFKNYIYLQFYLLNIKNVAFAHFRVVKHPCRSSTGHLLDPFLAGDSVAVGSFTNPLHNSMFELLLLWINFKI
jgi:hypothetical protein